MRRITQLYRNTQTCRPSLKWQRDEMMDSAVQLYRQVDYASHFLINTFLKCCVHFECEHHHGAVWKDV